MRTKQESILRLAAMMMTMLGYPWSELNGRREADDVSDYADRKAYCLEM